MKPVATIKDARRILANRDILGAPGYLNANSQKKVNFRYYPTGLWGKLPKFCDLDEIYKSKNAKREFATEQISRPQSAQKNSPFRLKAWLKLLKSQFLLTYYLWTDVLGLAHLECATNKSPL
jgi:hypothetical protein